MLADELADAGDTPCGPFGFNVRGNFGLTILAADLSLSCNDDIHSQGNHDYQAHAHVYQGGADPLGSQGFAGVARHPSSSYMRPAEPKARGRFRLWGGFLF
jgi:hypothetical protein